MSSKRSGTVFEWGATSALTFWADIIADFIQIMLFQRWLSQPQTENLRKELKDISTIVSISSALKADNPYLVAISRCIKSPCDLKNLIKDLNFVFFSYIFVCNLRVWMMNIENFTISEPLWIAAECPCRGVHTSLAVTATQCALLKGYGNIV